ncbi:hypothetical protein TUM4644_08010 [Shewanella colwelliana]|nr:hypothetical protein TUM4644_08010 [Shewanella colwelliana]
MKLTQILTKKLTGFWLLSLAAVAFIFLLTALVSFVQLTFKFQQQQVSELGRMLAKHQVEHQLQHLDIWLPQIFSGL